MGTSQGISLLNSLSIEFSHFAPLWLEEEQMHRTGEQSVQLRLTDPIKGCFTVSAKVSLARA